MEGLLSTGPTPSSSYGNSILYCCHYLGLTQVLTTLSVSAIPYPKPGEKFYFVRIAVLSINCFFLWQNVLLKNAPFPKSFFKESILHGCKKCSLYLMSVLFYVSGFKLLMVISTDTYSGFRRHRITRTSSRIKPIQ